MREDAKNLLEQLGASAIDYHEFPGRYNEFEYWPLFSAMLADPQARARFDAAETLSPSGVGDARAMLEHLTLLTQQGEL